MNLTRRQLLGGAAALGAIGWTQPAFGQQPRIRRNIFDLSGNGDDLETLARGLTIMRQRSDELSLEMQRALHAQHGQHGSWRFFPWHRIELATFESIIAAVTGRPDFALPYWDYQQTGALPRYFSDASNPFFHPGRGPTNVNYADRRWGASQAAANLLQDPFYLFVGTPDAAGRVEALGHNMVHGLVGGDMGSLVRAPLDPVFYLHHCNVDRVWQTWLSGPAAVPPPPQWAGEQLSGFMSANGPLEPVPAGSVLDTLSLNYAYDRPYPFILFNANEPRPPAGKTRRETIGTQTYRGSAAVGRDGIIRVALPRAVTRALREDTDQSVWIDGAGTAAFARQGLSGQVVQVSAEAAGAAGARPVVLSASAAILHAPEEACGQRQASAGHAGHGSYAHRFRFGSDILNLVKASRGDVALTARTIPIGRGTARVETCARARPTRLDYELTLHRGRWV